MVFTENKMSMSLINDPYKHFRNTVKEYCDKIDNSLNPKRTNLVAELFHYMIVTKNIWRFHPSLPNKFIDILLYKIKSFRTRTLSDINQTRVKLIFENMEHSLDLFCSSTTNKNKLCSNKLTHRTMLMCTMHKNKEIEKAKMIKIICQRENYFPSDLISLISLYIYSK
jgi:hypothetical protein